MRARRYGESALLLLFLAGTVILDLVAASRTWEYPVFQIRDTAKAQFEICLWRAALAAAVSAVSAAAICVQGRAGRRAGAAVAATVILLLLFCRFAAPGQRRFWYEAQQLAGGAHPLICCCFLKRTEGKIRARTAGVCGSRRAEQAGEGLAGVCGRERTEQAGKGTAGAYVEALAAGVLLCCAVGLISEANLLYGGDAGVMAGRNSYRIIPMVCLAALNALGERTSRIKGSGTCIESTDAAGCKARLGREEIYE